MAGVIADPEEGLGRLGDAGKRPQLGRIAVRPGTAPQRLLEPLQVGGREPRLASGPTGSAQRRGTAVPKARLRAADALARDIELTSDVGLRDAPGEQLRRPFSQLFHRLEVPTRSH